jgi:predicted CoA-binding protein
MHEKMMLDKKVWAVVGASNDNSKFGNKIFKRLLEAGYVTYPVNPLCDTVEGRKCYKDLSSLPEKPDVIEMVVSPKRCMAYIDEAAELGIKNVWLQPGTHDAEVMKHISEKGLTAVQGCVIAALR